MLMTCILSNPSTLRPGLPTFNHHLDFLGHIPGDSPNPLTRKKWSTIPFGPHDAVYFSRGEGAQAGGGLG